MNSSRYGYPLERQSPGGVRTRQARAPCKARCLDVVDKLRSTANVRIGKSVSCMMIIMAIMKFNISAQKSPYVALYSISEPRNGVDTY